MSGLTRREWIAAFLGTQVAATVGCRRPALPPAGELLTTPFDVGHQIRDADRPLPTGKTSSQVPIMIVGGGIAGLSAAWRLRRAGVEDFQLLELESRVGGTSQSGSRASHRFPWGAHYIPVPMANNQALIQLLDEMDVVQSLNDDGSPVIREQFLCRDPQERLFFEGRWHEGIFPFDGASQQDLDQYHAFRAEIDRWVDARDSRGRRMFAIPIADGSDSPDVRSLDQQSMAQWMDQQGWNSPRLRWLVNYACRDDYGLSMDQTSAWAGVFYFASRVATAGRESQSVMTWPEGNGYVVDFLKRQVGDHIHCGKPVVAIEIAAQKQPNSNALVIARDAQQKTTLQYKAEHIIFAAPKFLTKYLIRSGTESFQRPEQGSFAYGSWLVANVHLKDRPAENGFPMCWDNVIYDSKSLGYVTSTHQQGIDHGSTVLTWYYPFADVEPKITRQQMLQSRWADWADLVVTDLRIAHPDIEKQITRIDVMLWGHAMIQPRVGFVWSPSRIQAANPVDCVHFAGSDLSGIALFEEAFYHGVRAAEEVLTRRNHPYQSLLAIQPTT